MAPSYQQLLEMSDEQLIAAHDGAAKHTVLGINYYLDELRRRATDRQTQRMVELTEAIERGDGPGLHLLLNHFVEDVRRRSDGYELVCRNTVTSAARMFIAPTVVLAGGSIETPKLMRRSSMFEQLPSSVRGLVGRGLTDQPTTDEMVTFVTGIGDVPVPKTTHAKIIFYSRGLRDGDRIRFPFNVKMNINHEYWHLRDNDPNDPTGTGPARSLRATRWARHASTSSSASGTSSTTTTRSGGPPFEYVPEIRLASKLAYLVSCGSKRRARSTNHETSLGAKWHRPSVTSSSAGSAPSKRVSGEPGQACSGVLAASGGRPHSCKSQSRRPKDRRGNHGVSSASAT